MAVASRAASRYTIEDAHVAILPGFYTSYTTNYTTTANGLGHLGNLQSGNISSQIMADRGTFIVSEFGVTLTYDTRNSFQLPNHGQSTELLANASGPPGDTDFYKLEMRTSWFFPGFANGHILELDGRTGVVSPWDGAARCRFSSDGSWAGYIICAVTGTRPSARWINSANRSAAIPFSSRTAEYSIPIIKMLRVAAFYDIGNVYPGSFSFAPGPDRGFYSDDVGLGLRIILPIGGGTPLRLDYGVPITHDSTVGSSGHFQFGFGFTHPF